LQSSAPFKTTRSLDKALHTRGLIPSEKKSGGRCCNTRSFTFEDIKHTASFINNYAQEHALVLPCRVPEFSREDIKLLPSSETKRKVYGIYIKARTKAGNPLQPGPMYFLVLRKVGLFGVCCEGLPKQMNFCIDEAHLISKGSNAVISYLHYFFENYGLGETDTHLHCDNCSGQNKNRFVLWYCAWRCCVGLHQSITLNF